MSMTTDALREELFKLTAAERLELVEELWDSIATETERDADVLPPTEAQKEELDRRVAAHRADPSRVVPWEEVRKELRREQK